MFGLALVPRCSCRPADNADHLGTDRLAGNPCRETLSKHVKRVGFLTQDIVRAYLRGRSLGVFFDGQIGCVRSTLLERQTAFVDELLRVLGHVTIICLPRRPLLSMLSAVCFFSDKTWSARRRLWPAMLRELWMMRQLRWFVAAFMKAAFSSRAFARVACRTGLRVMTDVEAVFQSRRAVAFHRIHFGDPSPCSFPRPDQLRRFGRSVGSSDCFLRRRSGMKFSHADVSAQLSKEDIWSQSGAPRSSSKKRYFFAKCAEGFWTCVTPSTQPAVSWEKTRGAW